MWAALVVLGIVELGAVDAPATPPRLGDHAPPLGVEALDGRPFARPRLEGDVTVVDFFATWCGPCHRALADLAEIESRAPRRARLVIVAVGEDAPVVRRFFAQHPPPPGAEIVLDRSAATARAWGQDRFPTTFLVDATGVIRHINRGWGAGYAERVGRWLAPMLAQRLQ